MGPTPPPVFGQPVMTLSLLESLRRLGHLAAHVDTRDNRSLANLNRLDLENVRLGLLAAWRLARLLVRHPEAGVYVQISQGRWGFLRDALWIWLARAARRPVYVHLHGGRFQHFHAGSGLIMRLVIRATVAQAESLWVLTASLRSCFHGLADPGRVRVVENVVADPMPAGPPAADRERFERGLRILFLSNLRPEKGYDELLAALGRLGRRAAGWHLRLVGDCDEPTRTRIAAWTDAHLDGDVTVDVTGTRTGAHKVRELGWADVMALPTRYRNEGQPLVLLEGMAAGLAIVSTRHRGIPETVREEREAVLVDPGDADGLATALTRLASDPQLRAKLGAAARARYEERYTPERLDRDLAELLRDSPRPTSR